MRERLWGLAAQHSKTTTDWEREEPPTVQEYRSVLGVSEETEGAQVHGTR